MYVSAYMMHSKISTFVVAAKSFGRKLAPLIYKCGEHIALAVTALAKLPGWDWAPVNRERP
jgi:hypothetical protein